MEFLKQPTLGLLKTLAANVKNLTFLGPGVKVVDENNISYVWDGESYSPINSGTKITRVTEDLTQGVKFEAQGFPAIILSGHTYSASHFGIKSFDLTGDLAENVRDQLPDNTAGWDAIQDKYANWRGDSTGVRPLCIQLDPGITKTQRITWDEHPFVFQQKLGLIIQGAGSANSFIIAEDSEYGAFVSMNSRTNYIGTPVMRGVSLIGARDNNPNQCGVFINPPFSNSLDFGGLTSADWYDIQIRDFACEQLMFRGGSSSFSIPVQYSFWDSVRLQGRSLNHNTLRFTGQMGPPWNMKGLEVNNRDNFLRTVTTTTTTDVLTLNAVSGILVGHSIVGNGVPPGTYVLSISTGTNSVIANQSVSVTSNTNVVFGTEHAALVYVGVDNRVGLQIANLSTSNNSLLFQKPHRFKTTDKIMFQGGTPWGGLSLNTTYFVYVVDEYRIQVCATQLHSRANPPIVIPLTTTLGTATVASDQIANREVTSEQLILETFTCQVGGIALQVNSGIVIVKDMHCEEIKKSVLVENGGKVEVQGFFGGNAAQGAGTGVLFEKTGNQSRLKISGMVKHDGNLDLLYRGDVDLRNVMWTGGPKLTTGENTTGTHLGEVVLQKSNSIDPGDTKLTMHLEQLQATDVIFDTGPISLHWISHQGGSMEPLLFKIWPGAEGTSWSGFGTQGNLDLCGKARLVDPVEGVSMRVPVGAVVLFTPVRVYKRWQLTGIVMPIHEFVWNLVDSTLDTGQTVEFNCTCPGARSGDLRPEFGIFQTLPPGLLIEAIPLDENIVKMRITNFLSTTVTIPASLTGWIKQVR
jgi:hypothetical protein